ncbi:MAG: hypothetical protein IJA89_07240 [Clostridia bacterium]|nr:hypothetical protein [Clostridia bacterium]
MTEMNENPNVYAVPYPTEPVAVPQMPMEAQPQPQTEEPTPKKKTNAGYRVFAAILAVAAIAIAFLLDLHFLGWKPSVYSIAHCTIFEAVKEMFALKDYKIFGVLPTTIPMESIGSYIIALPFYVMLLFLSLAVIFGIITIFTNKKSPALFSATAFFFTAAFAIQFISVWANVLASWWENYIDYTALALIAVGFVCYTVAALIKNGKSAWFNLLQFILTLAAMGIAFYCLARYLYAFHDTVTNIFKWVGLSIVGIVSFSILSGAIRMRTKKGIAFDIVRFIVQFILGVFVCYVAIASEDFGDKTKFLIFAIVVAAVSLLQIVLAVIAKKASGAKAEDEVCEREQAEKAETESIATEPVKKEKKSKKAKKQKAVQAQAVAVPEFVVEEYAEALPYTGGPVEGVEIAQEVNPTYVAPPAPVQTAGYDFYNTKSFDPFIALLENEERNQFTEIFILKYKGDMPEIPTYQVGGDNKEFFRKTFIYLGQYRDKIPDGLLAKMYQFSIKM